MSENAQWYVVHTYSGYENTVATSIKKAAENRQMQDLIQEVVIPMETVVEHTDNGDKEVERKLFPGYVLVKMIITDESWHLVRNSRGCTGFVGAESDDPIHPIPLTEDQVIGLGVEHREFSVGFGLGDTVKIIDGPFEGYSGTVDELNPERDSVRVIISMFGRETPIDLELDQVEPVKEE